MHAFQQVYLKDASLVQQTPTFPHQEGWLSCPIFVASYASQIPAQGFAKLDSGNAIFFKHNTVPGRMLPSRPGPSAAHGPMMLLNPTLSMIQDGLGLKTPAPCNLSSRLPTAVCVMKQPRCSAGETNSRDADGDAEDRAAASASYLSKSRWMMMMLMCGLCVLCVTVTVTGLRLRTDEPTRPVAPARMRCIATRAFADFALVRRDVRIGRRGRMTAMAAKP